MGTKVKLQNVRLFFNDLFQPVEFTKGDGKPRFNATFGILKTDAKQLALVEAAFKAEAEAVWGKTAAKTLAAVRAATNKCCLSDGDAVNWEGAEGCMVLSSHRKSSDGKPGTYGRNIDDATGKLRVLTESDGVLYSGCYVNATVEIWAQKGEHTGMRCGLLAVQFNAPGDSFSGASKPDDGDFEDLGAGADADEMS